MSRYASGKIVKLTAKLNPADATLYADIDVWVTTGRLYFNSDLQEEWIDFTWVAASGTSYAYSGLTRWLSQTADPATAWTGKTWIAGSSGTLVAMHDQLVDKQKDNTFEWANTFEWVVTVEEALVTEKWVASTVYANTAARDAALWGDWAATKAYTAILAGSVYYNYNTATAQWESVDTWTVTPDGSETVSGKFELSTNAEQWTQASTWGTWARLVVPNDQLVKSSSGAWDENKPAILGPTWKFDTWFIDYTWAISSYTLWEDMTALDQAVLQTDWNIYKWDGFIDSGVEYVTWVTLNSTRIISVDTNTVVSAYIDTVSDDLFLRAWSVSDCVITYWTEVTVDASVATGFDLSLIKLDTNSWLVMYYDWAWTVYRWCPFTVSWTTITIWTPTIINATASNVWDAFECCTIDTNKVLFHYASWWATTDATVRVWTVSGNVLTLGTEDTDWAAVPVTWLRACKLDTDKALLSVIDSNDDVVVAACTVSWTTITVDTANKDTYTWTAVRPCIQQVSTDLALIAFDETDIKSFFVSVSTTTPTIQTAYTLVASTTLSTNKWYPLFKLNDSIYWIQHTTDKITYFTIDTTNYTLTAIGTVDYWTALWSSIDFSMSNAIVDGTWCLYINDKALSSKKTYNINFNSHYLLWILQETWTSWQSKQVSVSWQISAWHSSLEVGQKYYSANDWTYTLDASTSHQISMIGKAISTTSILVNIPYEDL